MLYDNAQFVRALCNCFAATSDDLFKHSMEETVDFLLTEMRADGGGFYSSFDADSEGEEGKYYVWSRQEIETALGPQADVLARFYDVSDAGNWEGRNILNRLLPDTPLSPEEARAVAECRAKLLSVRNRRPRPACDDKVLTDWNGLAVRALAEAGVALDRRDWIRSAVDAYDFVAESVVADSRLAHAWRDGAVAGPALATDYASMINAAVSLHLATGSDKYLSDAERWAEQLEAWHADGKGGYYLASASRSDLLIRARSEQDEAIPSATAMAIEALSRLGQIANNTEFTRRAETALAAAWGRTKANPFASPGILNAADTVLRVPKLVVTGPEAGALGRVAQRHPDPARLDIHLSLPADIKRHLGVSPEKPRAELAYLCRGPVCLPPIAEPDDLERLLSQPTNA